MKGQISTAAQQVRRRRYRAARQFRPDRIDLLLVAEAPPCSSDRYFYFKNVAAHDSLFRYVTRAILGVEPNRENKPQILSTLRDRGVFLIDVREDPVDGSPIGDSIPMLIRRIKRLQPARIILIKINVYDAAYSDLAAAGLPVIDERIPFPGSGQQRRFEEAFARALRAEAVSS
jgi:hypothetical protein